MEKVLNPKKKYLQIALNSSLEQASQIIAQLPASERIILEAGTPLLKRYGQAGIKKISALWQRKIWASTVTGERITPYVVADYKAMDRGAAEVKLAANAGANAITVLGQAPIETVDRLIKECQVSQIDPIIDMMNVRQPYKVLRCLKKLPTVVMLHRGVDETEFGNTPLPIHLINKVRGTFNTMIAIGGGDNLREVQSSFFNGADIVMLWREFYQPHDDVAQITAEFLKQVK